MLARVTFGFSQKKCYTCNVVLGVAAPTMSVSIDFKLIVKALDPALRRDHTGIWNCMLIN